MGPTTLGTMLEFFRFGGEVGLEDEVVERLLPDEVVLDPPEAVEVPTEFHPQI